MKSLCFGPVAVLLVAVLAVSCSSDRAATTLAAKAVPGKLAVPVNPSHFVSEALIGKIVQEERTLSDGSQAMCYVVQTYSKPHEHEMGPWSPKSITDDKKAGGIWFKDGKVYDVDGPFIKNMATFYNDPEWKLYRDDGSVRVTDTKEAFEAAARPDVDPRYHNHVVEGRPEWVAGKITTYVIPVTPIFRDEPLRFGGGPGGPPPQPSADSIPHDHLGDPQQSHRPDGLPRQGGNRGAGQGGIGLAFNGVNFDPPAPVQAILSAHTIAPFDDAGGHINPHEGYHYHAATGHTKEIAQEDGHAPMIGYILDGFGLYAYLDAKGNPPADLDECGGHSDEKRGYHYHAGSPGSNQIIRAFRGIPGTITVKD